MEAINYSFTDDDMAVNETLGYPKAYAKLCRSRNAGPYTLGPPFTFTPYSLQPDEVLNAEELEWMFPIIDPEAKPTAKPKIFVSLLWKQLNHLGNAGFDPAVIRVDPYGNVVYYHADSVSPLAWDIDHWFPCSRGGLTVSSNLRILQWQSCKRKHSNLEFLIPWWDFQLGISVNQFLSIFASSNSDFRHRAFSFLFADAETEEINPQQAVDSHSFPHHFVESLEKNLGLAPAAIVVSKRESRDSASVLRSLDYNRQGIAGKKEKQMKENTGLDQGTSTYQAIVMARDSLKHKEEATRMKSEIHEVDSEVSQLKRKNEEDKLAIQDLELSLIKRRRRAEKCRRLAESQSSYRMMLEKMIRDAMHQSVIYKEQVRLNQAAANALMARLEAQKAICDSSEKDLHKIHKQKEEIEREIRPEMRKRTRIDEEELVIDEHRERKSVLYLPGIKQNELRSLMEEENQGQDDIEHKKMDDNKPRFRPLSTAFEGGEDGENRKQRGKENVEKWLQMLLEDAPDELLETTGEIIKNKSLKYPHKEEEEKKSDEVAAEKAEAEPAKLSVVAEESGEGKERRKEEKKGKEKGLVRSESARILRRIPSSPSIILKKGVDWIRKKPVVFSDDEGEPARGAGSNRFFRSPFKTIKKTVKM